jgi:hypothetical protein
VQMTLSLVMLATKKPYEIDDLPSAAWLADMLNLPDAEQNGARRVASALRWLHAEGFILRKPRPGHTPHLTILQPGSESAAGGRYVQVPLDIWREGWILTLSCRALAIYIVLREATGGRHGSAVIPGSRKAQYDLSDEIWAKAAAELTAVGLLEVRDVFEKSSQRNEFESARRRLRYTLSPDDLIGQDGKNAGATASRTAARKAVRPAAQRGHAPHGRGGVRPLIVQESYSASRVICQMSCRGCVP